MQRTVLDMEDAWTILRIATCACGWMAATMRIPGVTLQAAFAAGAMAQRPKSLATARGAKPVFFKVRDVLQIRYGLYTYVSINFLFNRGGHVYPFVNMISCFQDPMTTPLETLIPTAVAIGIWLVLQLKLLVDEIRDAIRTARASKHGFWQGLLRDYLRFWNAVDWVSIAVAAMVIVFWLNVRTQVEVVNGLLPSVVRATLYPSPEAGTVQEQRLEWYQPTADTWFAAAEQMVLANSACIVTRLEALPWFSYAGLSTSAHVTYSVVEGHHGAPWKLAKVIIILYPLVGQTRLWQALRVIMLRLFKSFQAQPRLAIVTETIKTAVPDLAHFFVVALCIFGCLFAGASGEKRGGGWGCV
ncbi:pkd-2 [Symbiodinium natans]|uniref:Pkd-2 protein n=1 Tax=Symbiodinium natans TaxID=878477 RepID=A0A812SDV2_9DINO|nr:pkd-2 [Symbiodinium natans]